MTVTDHTPRHLLLATDLSARCDRARDRAVALARSWGARLTVVHALDGLDIPNDQPSRPTLAEASGRAKRLLRADFADVKDVAVDFQVSEGRPGDIVLDTAADKGCDFIVTGIAGNEPLGQSLLGSTVTKITRHAAVPTLVVKKRPRGAYRRVTVASDLSEPSRSALDLALNLFPKEHITLFHAFDMPLGMWVDNPEKYREECRSEAIEKARAFLAGTSKGSIVRVMVADGDPAPRIADHVAQDEVDLVIAGKHDRSGFAQALLGSVVSAILDEVSCDILIAPSRDRST